MIIRKYEKSDLKAVAQLFYDTVHTVNAGDYTAEELNAWTESSDSLRTRRNDLLIQRTLIAENDGVITGIGSIDKSGCLDLLFTHKDYQGQGIATALCEELEKGFTCVKTYASVTAKPFFEKRGYVAVKAQDVQRSGVKLKNFEMQKNIPIR